MSEQLCVLPHDVERLAQDGHYLCPGHTRALPERLRNLAYLHTDLANSLIATGNPAGERVTTSKDYGLNLDATVVELRAAIHDNAAGWARIVCEERDVHPPTDDSAIGICFFLVRHASWIAEQPWVDELWADLIFDADAKDRDREANQGKPQRDRQDTRALTSRARSRLQPSDTRFSEFPEWICPTEDCDGHLVAAIRDTDALLPSKVSCTSCKATWSADSWLSLGRKLRERAQA